MKTIVVAALVTVTFGLALSAALAAFEEGVRLKASNEVIDVEIGHLVPCVSDWNSDGKKDLIVGQFSGGKIRLYLNHGTDKEPVFKDFEYLKAAGSEISLPAG